MQVVFYPGTGKQKIKACILSLFCFATAIGLSLARIGYK